MAEVRTPPRSELEAWVGDKAGSLAKTLRETPYVAPVAEFMGWPSGLEQVENLTYGLPATTGSGETWRVKPETADIAGLMDPVDLARAATVGALRKGMGIFTGPKSAGWDPQAADNTRRMLDERKLSEHPVGSDEWMDINEEVWNETGYFMSPTGKLRREISDAGMEVTTDLMPERTSPVVESRRRMLDHMQALNELLDPTISDPQLAAQSAVHKYFSSEGMLGKGKNMKDLYMPEVIGAKTMLSDALARRASRVERFGELNELGEPWTTMREDIGMMRDELAGVPPDRYGTLSDAMKHEALFSEYPKMAGVETDVLYADTQTQQELRDSAFTNPQKPEGHLGLGSGSTPTRMAETLIHEPQHLIQQKEGWELGSGPEMMDQAYQREVAHMDPDIYESIIRKTGGRVPEWDAFHAYQLTPGEAEARAAALRRDLDPDELMQDFPLRDYDQPVRDLLTPDELDALGVHGFMDNVPPVQYSLDDKPWYHATMNEMEGDPRMPESGHGLDAMGFWMESQPRGTGNPVYDALSDPNPSWGQPGREYAFDYEPENPLRLSGGEPWDQLEAMAAEQLGPDWKNDPLSGPKMREYLLKQGNDAVVLEGTKADTEAARDWAIALRGDQFKPWTE